MIQNHDRSKWFGASDTSTILSKWDTETFRKWWIVKLGVTSNNYTTWSMEVGNLFEIPIIHKIESLTERKIKLGKQPVYNRAIRLRANYDGLCENLIEIKTSGEGFDKVPQNYWQQCQVLMFATERKLAELWVYRLEEFDYIAPYFPDIDEKRLRKFDIEYDGDFILNIYLPRVSYLADCLRKRRFPVDRQI